MRKIITSVLAMVGLAVMGGIAPGPTAAWAGDRWTPRHGCTYDYTRHGVNNGVLIDRRGNYRVYTDHLLQRATNLECDGESGIRAAVTFRCQRYDARTERWVGTPCAASGQLNLYRDGNANGRQTEFQFTAAQVGADGLISVYGYWDLFGCPVPFETDIVVFSLTIGGATWTNMVRDGSHEYYPSCN
jgi:hypothetical protein